MSPSLNIKDKLISYNNTVDSPDNIKLEETREEIEAIPASEIAEWIKNKIESLIN